MPQRRPIVPPVRKTLKLSQEISVATTNVPYPVTAEVGMEAFPTGNPSIRLRIQSALALESGSSIGEPVIMTTDENMGTSITDTLRSIVTGKMLTSSCPTTRRNGIG